MFQIYGLNYHYMKEVAFAEQNFHCGYFLDGDALDDILHFRNDTLDTYYQRVKEETKGVTRFFSKIFSRPVIYFLSNPFLSSAVLAMLIARSLQRTSR